MNTRFMANLPWALSFSFARAIQQPALEVWLGELAHVSEAQKALRHRALCNQAACQGEYTSEMEQL
jgi:fructose-bisphosphate aldolase class I